MKFISIERKYIDLENDKTDDYDALGWAQDVLEEIADNMDINSYLASEDYNLGKATKQDVLNAIEILDLLIGDEKCYIEYRKEN